jgi:hypothetical protein
VQHQRHSLVVAAEMRSFQLQLGLLPTELGKAKAPTRQTLDEQLAQARKAEGAPLDTNYTKMSGPSFPATSSGRRLAFARWLTSSRNPLAARVAMNHIWLRHFGQAIVPSVADFGRNGRPPSHPALLDWLADEFMRQGWSMKAMHRLLVTSNTYQQASTPDTDGLARDPDNRYLWRMTPRRLEAEAVRDEVFFVSGSLDTRLGGADIDFNLGLSAPRRTLYFRTAAEKQMEFVQIFDGPAVNECYERRESVMPQHALDRQAADDDLLFLRLAYERVLCRLPSRQETAECLHFLHDEPRENSSPASGPAPLKRREMLVHVLFNHHEFVTIR